MVVFDSWLKPSHLSGLKIFGSGKRVASRSSKCKVKLILVYNVSDTVRVKVAKILLPLGVLWLLGILPACHSVVVVDANWASSSGTTLCIQHPGGVSAKSYLV